MKKIITAVLLLAIISMSRIIPRADVNCVPTFGRAKERESITYLLCGYDDAAGNTDSIVLASYRYSSNTMTFLQIPRDTYYASAAYSKINSVYPTVRASGKSEIDALRELQDVISAALGIQIDSSIGYTMDTFVGFIDAIGGVEITLPKSFAVKSDSGEVLLSLEAGKSLLSGKEALTFVRARNGYTTGDLGRIDAQKIFLSAFMSKLKNDVGFTKIVKACISTAKGWTVDAKIGDLFKIISKNKGRISSIVTQYVNIPGSAVCDERGLWYYSVTAHSTDELLSSVGFTRCGAFDPDEKLLNEADAGFANIYNSTDIRARIYDDAGLKDLDIGMR